jgi:hypothetical protein
MIYPVPVLKNKIKETTMLPVVNLLCETENNLKRFGITVESIQINTSQNDKNKYFFYLSYDPYVVRTILDLNIKTNPIDIIRLIMSDDFCQIGNFRFLNYLNNKYKVFLTMVVEIKKCKKEDEEAAYNYFNTKEKENLIKKNSIDSIGSGITVEKQDLDNFSSLCEKVKNEDRENSRFTLLDFN